MKKIISLLLCIAMATMCLVGCGNSGSATTETQKATYRVAMVTDYGDITDESFNQATYEGCKEFCEANGIEFTYKKPTGDSTAERVAMIDAAINDGYNIVVLPGYAFGAAIVESAPKYPDVKFVALDVSKGDLGEDFVVPENVFCAVYQEELSGFMAGYAATKMGYKHLGFLGGMAVPAVVRYGYGYLQGIDEASKELGNTKDITVEYVYGNQFFGDAQITSVMDGWFQEKGTEVVFACGGGIYTSVVDAATKTDVNGKLIGVDVNQGAKINKEHADLCITSAMKGLSATVKTILSDTILNDGWSKYAGQVSTLGIVSGTDPEANYVQIPYEDTLYTGSFSKEDYKSLVAKLADGTIKVSNDANTEVYPTVGYNLNTYGNIK